MKGTRWGLGWALWCLACGGCGGASPGASPARADEPTAAAAAAETDPRRRAEAGGWTSAPPAPPPHFCDEDGGTEWCDGANDDDCDGVVDEGCVDCVREDCVRYRISEEEARRGAGRDGAVCVGPVYCGRIDGYATTTPPGGCGDFHCGTILWSDGTAQPNHCTIHGRCEGGAFTGRGFSW